MKKRTLKEEIERIKKINGLINELYHEDDDDYLYDPEYYEQDLDDPDEEESDDDDESMSDFSHEMLVSPRKFDEIPLKKNKEEEGEPDSGFYGPEDADNIFNKLKNNELLASDIDKRALTQLLNIGVIEFNKDKEKYELEQMRGKLKRGVDDFDLGTFKFINRKTNDDLGSIINDQNVFRVFINNAIELYKKKR